ncbi:MAG: serine hydrolase domain-containing protein [Saprospiraceae bacterium]|nr:serine hydrolase domain-containing protein [Saprospiraceae bacterium]
MTRRVCILLCLFFVCQPAFAQAPSGDGSPHIALEQLVDSLFAHNYATQVPGLVIEVMIDGERSLSKGYGFADLATQTPMTPRTAVRAGSVSKPVTAVAAVLLAQNGLIELDTPVDRYIDDLDLTDRFGPASTVRQLLVHQGGYPDRISLTHAPSPGQWAPLGQVLREDLPGRAFAPGQVMAYSSWDYALLGYVMEKATGMPYEQLIATELLTPLGMLNSTYEQPVPARIASMMATGYGVSGDGTFQIVPHDFVRMSPGVALVTTGEDMATFMAALLPGSAPDSAGLLTNHSRALIMHRQAAAHRYSRGRTLAFSELRISGRPVLYHDGNGIGFTNRLVIAPEHGFGIFISINHRVFDRTMTPTAANAIVKELSAAVIEACLPERRDTVQLHPAVRGNRPLQQYEGYYRLAQVSRTDLFRIQSLLDNVTVRADGNTLLIGTGHYRQIEPLLFQHEDHPQAFVVFVADANNAIRFLTFGGTGSYERVSVLESPPYQMGLLLGCTALFLSMVVVWPFRRHGHWSFWVASLLHLGYIVGIGMLFSGAVDLLILFKSVPFGVQLVFLLPWVNGMLSLVLVFLFIRSFSNTRAFTLARAHQGLVILACLAMFWFAHFWNLIA